MAKNIAVYQTIEESINGETGEFKRNTKFTSRRIGNGLENEEEYIRVYKYLNVLFAYENIPLALVPAVIEISKYMTNADTGQLVTMHSLMREQICNTLGISISRLNKIVKQLREADILRDTSTRGTYAVNPFIVSAGKSTDVKTLQAKFDFHAEQLVVYKESKNLITGKVVRQAIVENKKKLSSKDVPGQLSLPLEEDTNAE